MERANNKLRVGILGCGAIGTGIALFIDKKLNRFMVINGLVDKQKESARKLQNKLKSLPKICDIENLVRGADLIIEAASQSAAKSVIEKAINFRKNVMILSTGVFVNNFSLIGKVIARKIKLYIPSGAICGIDGVGALSMGKIKSLSLVTSKPPKGFEGVEYLINKKVDLSLIKKETVVFKGGVKRAVKYFPKNINVAATLLLASCLKDISVCIKADPKLKRNIHNVRIEAEEANLTFSVENIPSVSNPKTSALTILSTQKLLEKICFSFCVGS